MQQFNCNHQYPDSGSGYWHCSNALAKNLTVASDSDDALITIDQANDATIRVTVLPRSSPSKSLNYRGGTGIFTAEIGS